MDRRLLELETEINFLREQISIKDDYIKALEYAFKSIKKEVEGWEAPLCKVKSDGGEESAKSTSKEHGVFRGDNTVLS